LFSVHSLNLYGTLASDTGQRWVAKPGGPFTCLNWVTSHGLWDPTWLTDKRPVPRLERGRGWTAHVTFGRIGARGRTLRYEFANQAAATAFVRSRLRRRATAIRRLGVPYRPVDASPAADHLLVLTGLRPKLVVVGPP
jgi:hypothetical protein